MYMQVLYAFTDNFYVLNRQWRNYGGGALYIYAYMLPACVPYIWHTRMKFMIMEEAIDVIITINIWVLLTPDSLVKPLEIVHSFVFDFL